MRFCLIVRIIRVKRKSKNIKNKLICLSAIFLFTATFLFVAFFKIYAGSFRPIVKQMASYTAEQLTAKAISDGVIEVLAKTDIKYEDIVEITKNTDGELTSLSVNLFKINKLKSEVTLKITEMINEYDKIELSVPFGSVIATAARMELFSGIGPMIPVEIMPQGSVFTDFDNTFTATGINQTKHTVSLKIKAKISMITPENITSATETVSLIPIAESIIVGKIPDTYTVLETSPEILREDILNLQ